ncbi:hypothetical protein A0U89_13505 [Kozakia baliensis]|uniref:Uncharacterized protein n=1 Tax=Kozakia baliensis TaxID=153496 RepID=A0A1D8UWF5_9PROT|nr:hypothetical protein A0U89_13505 [Kozakia baliensis]
MVRTRPDHHVGATFVDIGKLDTHPEPFRLMRDVRGKADAQYPLFFTGNGDEFNPVTESARWDKKGGGIDHTGAPYLASCQVVRRHWDGVSWAIAAYAPWFDVERRSDC